MSVNIIVIIPIVLITLIVIRIGLVSATRARALLTLMINHGHRGRRGDTVVMIVMKAESGDGKCVIRKMSMLKVVVITWLHAQVGQHKQESEAG